MKTTTFKTLLTVVLSIWATWAYAQIEGLWEIKQVTVGNQMMTPTAKWTRINSDSTYQSGNGWLQNSEGAWTLRGNNYLPIENNGIKDPFGPFKVQNEDDKMTWTRLEDGDTVRVSLKRVNQLPQGPADQIQGLWDLIAVTKGEENLTSQYDPKSKRYVFLRWDRIFIDDLGPAGRLSGFWHMHGHRPSLTFISHDKNKVNEVWKVETSKSSMVWMGESDTNTGVKMVFERMTEFPNN